MVGNKIKSKAITIVGVIGLLGILTYSSVVVNKTLYIREVVKESVPAEEQPQTESESVQLFEEVTEQQMLAYLKGKYGEDFEALVYKQGAVYEKEGMVVYPEQGDDILDTFTIAKQADGTYNDTYMRVYQRPQVKKLVEDAVDWNDKHHYVHVTLTRTTAETKEDADTLNMDIQGVHANMTILLDGKEVSYLEVSKWKDKIRNQTQDLGIIFDQLDVKAVKVADFSKVNAYTYPTYSSDQYTLSGDIS